MTSHRTDDQLKAGWYLESRWDGQLLPVGPYASREDAEAAAIEIGGGRPVHITNPKERAHRDNPEPQEMTLSRRPRCPEDRHEWATDGGKEYCLYCGGR